MSLKTLLNGIRKSTGSESFTNSKYAVIGKWISSGSYALNRIMSGSIFKGFPQGRIIVLSGESSVGKTLVAVRTIKNALDSGVTHVFYVDAEGGALLDFFVNQGCDTDKIEHVIVANVQDAQIKVLTILADIREHKNTPEGKDDQFLIVIDSLGALVGEKVESDIAKGKATGDMGGTAKAKNTFIKAMTIPALLAETSVFLTNHVYDDPAAMYTSKIKNQAGGKGLQYMGMINVQCTRKLEKDEDKEGDSIYSGTNLSFFTVKNRMCRPYLEASMFLDFKNGFVYKYDGLFEEAVRYGFFVETGTGRYVCPTCEQPDKKFTEKQLRDADKVWESFINDFDKKSQEELKYSSEAQKAIKEQEELDEELEEALDEVTDEQKMLDILKK